MLAVLGALGALGALGLAAAPPAVAAAIPVAYRALLVPVRTLPLARAVVNPGPRHVEIKFRDGTEWEASYPPGAEPGLLRLLHARHVRVVFASAPPPRPARPRLRYVAGGAIVAAALGAGAFAWARSRRRRRRAHPPAAS